MTTSPVYETATIKFFISQAGEVIAKTKDGNKLPDPLISNILLLDIAQTLSDIRDWGIAQHKDGGQPTWVNR